ncbi:hypothetical protein CCUS01_16421 [Colletotrichum cuscutae]|uniref:Uncharacterized protein n=1 Tax=Colletotrichum cuscutae TaxID=1209917 RepID=A0AAI9V9L3_9PEZI|nr:hypothetical protein CCUS01_16421 [Colletotrichum cuscutae]
MEEDPHASSPEALSTICSALELCLQEERKGPPRHYLQTALLTHTRNVTDEARTWKLFLKTGAAPFLALLLADRRLRGRHPPPGCDPLRPLFNLPVAEQQGIADSLKTIQPSPSIRTYIDKVRKKLQDADEQTAFNDSFAPMAAVDAISQQPQSNVTDALLQQGGQVRNEHRRRAEQRYEREKQVHNEPPSHKERRRPNDQQSLNTGQPQPGQCLADASITGMASVFPQYTCGIIRKTDKGAVITMRFPYDQSPAIHCLMSLSILPGKLQRVADKLLGVHLEVEGGKRHLVLENLVTVRIMDGVSMSLQGALPKAIVEMLGEEADHAIATSPMRRLEVQNGVIRTACVTITITNNPEEDGQLNLNMGLVEGMAIRRRLYPQDTASQGL